MAERISINFSNKMMSKPRGEEGKERIYIKVPEAGRTYDELGSFSVPANWVHADQKNDKRSFLSLDPDSVQTIIFSKKNDKDEWEKTGSKEMTFKEIKDAFDKNAELFKASKAEKEAEQEEEDIPFDR